MVPVPCESWGDFFVEALTAHLVVGARPTGTIPAPRTRSGSIAMHRHCRRTGPAAAFRPLSCRMRREAVACGRSAARHRSSSKNRASPPGTSRPDRVCSAGPAIPRLTLSGPSREWTLHSQYSGERSRAQSFGRAFEGHVQEDPHCQPRRDRLPGHQDRPPHGHQDGRGLFRCRQGRAARRDGRRGRAYRPGRPRRSPTS